MAKKRLLWQLYPLCLLILVVSLVLVTWYASSTLKRFYLDQTAKDLESRAHLLVGQMLPLPAVDGAEALNRRCREFGERSGTRITVILPSGTVLCDSEEDPAIMENHGARTEIMEAYEGQTGIATRHSFTLKQDMMYVAVPLMEAGAMVGVVRTSIPVSAVDEALSSIYGRIALGGLAVAALAAMISFFISRRISRPLEAMRQGAERFARGELEHRMDISDYVEFESLAKAMNHMASRLDERIRTVIHQRNEQEAVLASMVEGVLAVDNEERIINLNKAAAEMIGVDTQEAKGRTLQEVIRNPALQEFVAHARESEFPVEGDIELGEDRDRFVQTHGTVLRGVDGTGIGVLVVLNDVTRLIKLENIRRDFVANVSHELKTPITSIKGFVETLLDGGMDDSDDARHFLKIVAKHADRLNAIIEDLLSLSRIEQGVERNEITLEKGPIRVVLEAAVRICEAKGQAKGIEIALECSDAIRARINPRLLEQAVVNLLDNAIKYSDPGSTIRVAGAEGVTISVADQGNGIPEEHLPRLFERFYRVDKARSRQEGGTGLGLAIVKHIVQSHKGRVEVKSQVNEGTTFMIRLPE